MNSERSEIIKDFTVAVCVVAATVAFILMTREIKLLMHDMRQDTHQLAVSAGGITQEVQKLVQVSQSQFTLDDRVKKEVMVSLKNVRQITQEAHDTMKEVHAATANANTFIIRLDDNVNGKILPELHIQIKTTGEKVTLTVDEVRKDMATLTLSTTASMATMQEILTNTNKVITDNQAQFSSLLAHTDTILLNIGDTTKNTSEITKTLNVWTKDNFKKSSLIVRIGSGIAGALLPRILK